MLSIFVGQPSRRPFGSNEVVDNSLDEVRSKMTLHEEPDEELIKEVYARFGLAYYESECLHRGLCHVLAIASFHSQSDITRPRVEEKLVHAFSLTLGQVKDALKGMLPDELFSQLDYGIEQRNFLAHHFWFERAHLMFNSAGLTQMIEELSEFSALFSKLDKLVWDYFEPKLKRLGITDDVLQNAFDKILSGNPPEPLPQKRKLKKQERLVRVWEFKLPDGTLPLIFETEDGFLWQLCDVGLGWTNYDKIGPDWKENKNFQTYLPANINPRPKDCHPWNYELKLAKNAVLWVKPGRRVRSFKWGIRTKSKN